MRLRLQGDVAPDRFAFDEMCMVPRGIMKLDAKEERMDNAEVKRVELHCHTKMSKLDGLTPMEGLVKQAIRWGHKALAITDHGVVQAFPFCFDAAEGSDLKLIFGMEGYLISDRQTKDDAVDTENPDAATKGKSKISSHHIIILAKNDVGRINLYRLISQSNLTYLQNVADSEESAGEPPQGLILGSACEAGELFQAILRGIPEEELGKIANFYDYLEVQPLGNNAFMLRDEKSSVNTWEDLQDLNRKVIELGEQWNKPVCATCDVHFLDPEDEVYRRIIMAGRGFDDADDQAPLYLHTTEEMLEEFSYLGSDKAEEIVITNTNMIADMIETIAPVRPDKCPPVIPDSDKTLTEICYNRAHEIYGPDLPQIVEARLEKELNSIIKTDLP